MYRIGKIIEKEFLLINPSIEYGDLVDIILSYVDDKKIKCDKLILSNKWILYVDNGNLKIKEKDEGDRFIINQKSNCGINTTIPLMREPSTLLLD